MWDNPWVYLTDEATGHSYYANIETREVSWRLPPALGGAIAEPLSLEAPQLLLCDRDLHFWCAGCTRRCCRCCCEEQQV